MALPNGLDLNKFKSTASNNASQGVSKPSVVSPRVVQVDGRKNAVIANVENIPSLPSIIFEITRLANSPKSCAADIEERMKNDQVLTAKLLKTSNSSYYALSHKVTTVSRAVTTLGFNAVKSIVIASSVNNTLNRDLQVYGYLPGGLWAHSLACAAIAKNLGIILFKASEEYSEELFIGGLLHDIGKIAIAPLLEKHKEEMLPLINENKSLTSIEDHVVGINHSQVGFLLASKWNLSEDLTLAIRGHHREVEKQFSAIVRLADVLAVENMVGLVPEYKWGEGYTNGLIKTLGLTLDSLHKLRLYIRDFSAKMVPPLIESMKI